MAQVIARKRGRRRAVQAKRGVLQFAVSGVVMLVGVAIAVYAMTR